VNHEIESLISQIAELTKIVQSLQEQLLALSVTESIPDLEGYVFSKDLEFGDSDTEVILLQKALNKAGFTVAVSGVGSAGEETNYYGELTRAAVKKLQTVYATETLHRAGFYLPTGIVDVYTRAIFNRISGAGQTVQQNIRDLVITSVSPTSGPNGSEVVITGNGFTPTGNTVNTTYEVFENVESTDGETLVVRIYSESIADYEEFIALQAAVANDGHVDHEDEEDFLDDLLLGSASLTGNASNLSPVSIHVVNSNGTSNAQMFNIDIAYEENI